MQLFLSATFLRTARWTAGQPFFLGKIAVRDDLPLRGITFFRGRHNGIDRISMQERFSTERHHGFDVIRRGDLTHRIGRNLRIDPLTARRVLSLGTVSAPSCAGVCHHEFNFIQIFQIFIFHLISFLSAPSPKFL